MQVCTSLQTDNHASTPLSFYRPDVIMPSKVQTVIHFINSNKGELFANISHKQIIIIISRVLQSL